MKNKQNPKYVSSGYEKQIRPLITKSKNSRKFHLRITNPKAYLLMKNRQFPFKMTNNKTETQLETPPFLIPAILTDFSNSVTT